MGEPYEQLSALVKVLSAPIEADENPFHELRAALHRHGLPADLLARIDRAASSYDKVALAVSEEHLDSDRALLQMHQESARQWALVITRSVLQKDSAALHGYVRAAALGIGPPGPSREPAAADPGASSTAQREIHPPAAHDAAPQQSAALSELAHQLAAAREKIDRIDARVHRRRIGSALAIALVLATGAAAGAFAAQRVDALRARMETLDRTLARLQSTLASEPGPSR